MAPIASENRTAGAFSWRQRWSTKVRHGQDPATSSVGDSPFQLNPARRVRGPSGTLRISLLGDHLSSRQAHGCAAIASVSRRCYAPDPAADGAQRCATAGSSPSARRNRCDSSAMRPTSPRASAPAGTRRLLAAAVAVGGRQQYACHEMAWVDAAVLDRQHVLLVPVQRGRRVQFRAAAQHPPFLPAARRRAITVTSTVLAVAGGKAATSPRLGETDTPAGWRPTKATGERGHRCRSGRPSSTADFSCPLAPRCAGTLWNAPNPVQRQLQTVEIKTGKRTPVAELPSFARGLAFIGDYAFISLSKFAKATCSATCLSRKRYPLAVRHLGGRCRSSQIVQLMKFEGQRRGNFRRRGARRPAPGDTSAFKRRRSTGRSWCRRAGASGGKCTRQARR